ncbi:MAG: teicoplanin resistance protein VanZ [bacterium]|nr:teicoplanin resistance protein VanZ [bacterium]
MSDPYIERRKRENIHPLTLPSRDKFYHDLTNIEHSWSGRMDIGNIVNTFIIEAEQQLINAIELFEQGYFDCAYYSLRSAVDLSTTMVYLADMPDEEKEILLNAWKETKDFPMQGQMIKQLSAKGNVFTDMKNKMPDFFAKAKKLSADLNKYVHKQGLRHFYVSRNHPLNFQKPQDTFIKNFEYYLKQCTSVVAVMRLAIDPFPILLMDEEILYRCFDSMTEPYSSDFVDEYIGQSVIDAYKTTDIYQGTYKSFICEEKKNEAVFNIVKHQYIDSRKMDEILAQLHLMSKDDIICTLMVYACYKVVKTYSSGGLLMYFTDKNTNRKAHSWSSLDFKNLADAAERINQPYDEAFISAFLFDEEYYYAEHNDKFDDDDLASIVGTVEGVLFKMKEPRRGV